jgi:hypothetical protein
MLLACLYWLLRFVGESSFPSTRKGFIFDQQMTKKKRVYLINDSSCCWVEHGFPKPNKLLIRGVIIKSY